jgi:hypothetical protein
MPERNQVVVVDVKIPFWSMVVLLVKWAIAAIPAFLILFALGVALSAAVAFLTGGGIMNWWFGRGMV